MEGSLQTSRRSIARPLRILAMLVTTGGSILVGDFAHSGTSLAVEDAAGPRAAEPAQCDTVAPAKVTSGPHGRVVQCARLEAGIVCEACPTYESDAGRAPVKTRSIGPRSPGGGPED
jgi:hypothetical protein